MEFNIQISYFLKKENKSSSIPHITRRQLVLRQPIPIWRQIQRNLETLNWNKIKKEAVIHLVKYNKEDNMNILTRIYGTKHKEGR